MEIGKILCSFAAKDGIEVILRTPKLSDLDDLLAFINALADENLDVLPELSRKTQQEEADWLNKRLIDIENDKVIGVVAEVDGRVIANSEVIVEGRSRTHVGQIGISVGRSYRDRGIGTEMMKTLIDETRSLGLKVLVCRVFASNQRARHVYETVGFKETGRVPLRIYRKGQYIDDVIMTLVL